MKITYWGDSGARYDWTCEYEGEKYVVSYHHLNDCWSVQLLRGDGEREVLAVAEAERILGDFPAERAFDLVLPDGKKGENRICDEEDSPVRHEFRDTDTRPESKSPHNATNGREESA